MSRNVIDRLPSESVSTASSAQKVWKKISQRRTCGLNLFLASSSCVSGKAVVKKITGTNTGISDRTTFSEQQEDKSSVPDSGATSEKQYNGAFAVGNKILGSLTKQQSVCLSFLCVFVLFFTEYVVMKDRRHLRRKRRKTRVQMVLIKIEREWEQFSVKEERQTKAEKQRARWCSTFLVDDECRTVLVSPNEEEARREQRGRHQKCRPNTENQQNNSETTTLKLHKLPDMMTSEAGQSKHHWQKQTKEQLEKVHRMFSRTVHKENRDTNLEKNRRLKK